MLEPTWAHVGSKKPSWSFLETSWRPLGPSWRHLEASWAHLGASWTYLGPSWPILEATWRRLGPLKSTNRADSDYGCGVAGPPFLRIILYVYVCISLVYIQRKRKVREDYEQEKNMSRLVRVWDSVRHAQAQGLARRIQSAAKLRSRHRAWQSAICSQDD